MTLYGSIAVATVWHRARLGRPLPSWVVVLSATAVVTIAALVGFSRTYRGHHHPSDVIWAVGLGLAWLVAGRRVVLDGRPGGGDPPAREREEVGPVAGAVRVGADA